MNPLKKLVGQTAIYGVSSIVGRFLNYFLVPLYTSQFDPDQYGVTTVLYAYVALLIALLMFGMETAFFRFSSSEKDKKKVYNTAFTFVAILSTVFILAVFLFQIPIAELIQYEGRKEYVVWVGWIITFDVLCSVPFAYLREQNKAKRFATIKLIGISANILLNLLFILLLKDALNEPSSNWHNLALDWYNPKIDLGYIFLINIVSSGLTFLLLMPEVLKVKLSIDFALWRKMIRYSLPIMLIGVAAILNETVDRILLMYLLDGTQEERESLVGIYGACYKLSIIMSLGIQAFRYAAEPFFFAESKKENAHQTYASVMKYASIVLSFVFLATMMYMEVLKEFLRNKEYWQGLGVVPVLLIANLFLGLYYNLSIWYKLTDRTRMGAWISLAGVTITFSLNFILIPIMGYMGSAWATLVCYASMVVMSYLLGQRYYPVKYDVVKILGYISLAVVLYLGSEQINVEDLWPKLGINTLLILIFVAIVWALERPKKVVT